MLFYFIEYNASALIPCNGRVHREGGLCGTSELELDTAAASAKYHLIERISVGYLT